MWDLIIVGGGAAGLWAAGTAAARGKRVLVLEKNKKPGVKILMSGGTRCNITHNCGVDGILQAFGDQARFLKPALYQLTPQDVVREFERLGVATKVEDTGKVFPVSDRALDVRDALLQRMQNQGAEIRSGVAVHDLLLAENGVWQVITQAERFEAAKVLLCVGGKSYPGCGTTGDGYDWARKFGHRIVDTRPALTPLLSPVAWVHELTGITLADVNVRVIAEEVKNKDPRRVSRGSFLWTHFGCSGPTAMNVSRFVPESAKAGQAQLEVDLVPDVDDSQLAVELNAASGGRMAVATVVQKFVPRKLSQVLMQRACVATGATLAELTKSSRLHLLSDLKRLVVPLSGNRGYAKAEVTRGGVATKEVNPKSLESRLVPGLFFAGEILDIDGPIGGYNFQAAFSTGHVVGLQV